MFVKLDPMTTFRGGKGVDIGLSSNIRGKNRLIGARSLKEISPRLRHLKMAQNASFEMTEAGLASL